jgi:hypothetical protein
MRDVAKQQLTQDNTRSKVRGAYKDTVALHVAHHLVLLLGPG